VAHLHVRFGDVVRAYFNDSSIRPQQIFVRVDEVRERFDEYYGERSAPLIIGRNVATGEWEHFDQYYVVEIVSRIPASMVPKINVFRGVKTLVHHPKKGVAVGSLLMLAVEVLGRLDMKFTRPIDEVRLRKLFAKSGTGVIENWHGAYTVRTKQFSRWARQNAYRILTPTAVLVKEATTKKARDYQMIGDDMDALDEMSRHEGHPVYADE